MIVSESDLIRLVEKSCSYDTTNPPGNEEEYARFLEGFLRGYGVETRLQEVGINRMNLIAEVIHDKNLPILLFLGHMDVVPAMSGWVTKAFSPVTKDGKLFARGSADMKGGLSALVAVMADLKNTCDFTGNVRLVATCDEEVGCLGIRKYLAESEEAYAGAIVAEPTSLRLAAGEKGAVWIELHTEGKAAHSSRPWEGKNAITRLFTVYGEIVKELAGEDDLTISMNRIGGGTKENVVPDDAWCLLDFRFGDRLEARKLIEKLCDIIKRFPETLLEIRLERPAFKSRGLLTETVRQVLKENRYDTDDTIMDYFTDGAFTALQGVETVIIGPGSPSLAHQANEYVEVAEIIAARELYATIAKAMYKKGR